ncbi:MAG TPA: tRNA preQ1(34) S-adenosylmethionine ribosyltransferase-isomerase QueA [Armatimonadota bacterium]|nr:tRNA preQ1(34) S-adenosylmethionine ribosyltransferase-isomerase QueA [Armatimonadota bacterium]
MKLDLFDYTLPPEAIAQSPAEPRDASRLLVLRRSTGAVEHRVFSDILDYFRAGDLLVLNNTRVRAARLMARKATGARVEVLALEVTGPRQCRALVRPGRRALRGATLIFADGRTAEVIEQTADGGRALEFSPGEELGAWIERQGTVPLPPYIHRPLDDPSRYQTVYNREPGSAAAPTAGLHFTPELLNRARKMGVGIAEVTLHVGLDTFRPVKTPEIESHEMHSEWYEVSEKAAEAIAATPGRIIAVGTTSVRTLEAAAIGRHRAHPGTASTRLYIRPGYEFRCVDALLTNFHYPRSSLLILVSAFAGRESIANAYQQALERGYRFLSLGDAMLVL